MLNVVSNEITSRLHKGNPDRVNPRRSYDSHRKAKGCLDAVKMLKDLTGPKINSVLKNRQGAPLPEIELGDVSSLERLNDPILLAQCERFIEAAHSKNYRLALKEKSAEAKAGKVLIDFGPEAAVSGGTYDAAVAAAAASMQVIDNLLQKRGTSFALSWPPGHHAEREQAMGFCYLNNVAIAALYGRSFGKKVAIIDIDNHTANGTRQILRNEKDIRVVDMDYKAEFDPVRGIYLDGQGKLKLTKDPAGGPPLIERGTYRDQGKEYPYRHADLLLGNTAHEIAYGDNILEVRSGFTSEPRNLINLYLDKVLPYLKKFKPDIILWSLGVDSAMGDPLGGLGHTPGSFYTLLAGTRKAFPLAMHGGVMEGGYEPSRWYSCLAPSLLALHDDISSPARSMLWKEYFHRFN